MKRDQLISNIRLRFLSRFASTLMAGERGVVLVFALVILVILAIIGASALMTSDVDLKLTGYTKVVREAFYRADSGVEMSPKVIDRVITDRALPTDTPLIEYATTDLLGEIMGSIDYGEPENDPTPDDIGMSQAGQERIAVNLTRRGIQYLSGGGTEFAAGTEGVGVGGATSTAVLYDFNSTGTAGRAPNTTISQVVVRYRKVAGVAGGK